MIIQAGFRSCLRRLATRAVHPVTIFMALALGTVLMAAAEEREPVDPGREDLRPTAARSGHVTLDDAGLPIRSGPAWIEWGRFRKKHGGDWQASWNTATRRPSSLYGGRTAPLGKSPERAARRFVDEHRLLFGWDRPGITLRLLDSRGVPRGRRVTFQQQVDGIDVHRGLVHVFIDGANRVFYVTNSTRPDVVVRRAAAGGPDLVRAAAEREFAGEKVSLATGPALVILPDDGRLAHLTAARVGERGWPWNLVTDAATGEVIDKILLVKRFAQGNEDRAVFPRKVGGGKAFPLPGSTFDPCLRQWPTIEYLSFLQDVMVFPYGDYPDSHHVKIELGRSAFDVGPSWEGQALFGQAAGTKLSPCIEDTIALKYYLYTWDAWTSDHPDAECPPPGGPWEFWGNDYFFFNINDSTFSWDWILDDTTFFGPPRVLCCEIGFLDSTGLVMPGFSGFISGEMAGEFCAVEDSMTFVYSADDSSKNPYLSIGLFNFVQESDYSEPVTRYASWGSVIVDIRASTVAFDPNPVVTLGEGPYDDDDQDTGVSCEAYTPVVLERLNPPIPGEGYHLDGEYVTFVEIAAPSYERYASRNGTWPVTRSCPMFENVMAYHHITRSQLYLQDLGFTGDLAILASPFHVDAHSETDTTSYYTDDPGYPAIVFDTFEVDDAEDADVILHEYGHAIQDDQVASGVMWDTHGNAYGDGDETGAIGEGFADYWAASGHYDACLAAGTDPDMLYAWALGYDAWRIGGFTNYPDHMTDDVHEDGRIWADCLWAIFDRLGKLVTDQLVLWSHYGITDAPLFVDAARHLVEADIALFGGAHVDVINEVFRERGIFRAMRVLSLPPGAAITLDPPDVLDEDTGTTPFSPMYRFDDFVVLQAPATHGGNDFKRWVLNGLPTPVGARTQGVLLGPNTEIDIYAVVAKAIYEYNTAVGTDVTAQPVDEASGEAPATLTFPEIDLSGHTDLLITDTGPLPPVQVLFPEGSEYYNLSTTAGYTGPIALEMAYNAAQWAGNEARLSLLRYDSSLKAAGWVDVTTEVDTVAHVIHASCDSLSVFIVGMASVSGVEDRRIPRQVALYQNSPNPFNPLTVIRYDLPLGGSRVKLCVYDVRGRLVRILVDEYDAGGGTRLVRWDGTGAAGDRVATGVYFYRLEAGNASTTRKMLMLK